MIKMHNKDSWCGMMNLVVTKSLLQKGSLPIDCFTAEFRFNTKVALHHVQPIESSLI